MERGTRVKMSTKLKKVLRANGSGEHVKEFGRCEGIVEEHLSHNGIEWPEVNVRWEPSKLRYGYLPDQLVRVK